MKSFLDLQLEVLSKDADAGKWIDDFVKSDDPKFAGKSAEKRKQMALAAYYAKQKNEGVKQVRGDDSLQYEEVELDEASRAETGELFKSLVNKANASSEAGNHTQAKRHLANAQTARYGILAKHMAKHQASFDKYKELNHSYTNSDEPVREEYHVVGNNSYYGDKQEPVKLSSHKSKEDAQAALAKHKSASNTERGNRSKWHKVVDDSGLKKHMDEDISIDEGVVDTIRKANYNRLADRSFKKAYDAHQDALDAPKTPAERRSARAEFNKQYDKGVARKNKADSLGEGISIDEKSDQAIQNKTMKNNMDASIGAKWKAQHNKTDVDVLNSDGKHKTAQSQNKAIGRALRSEESEELDELSNKLLNRYSKKAEKEAGKHFMVADRAQDRGNYDKAQTNMDKAEKRASGVYRAQSKIKEESVEESRGHKILATKLADMDRMKTVKIPSPAERRAELEKQQQGKKEMKEAIDTVKKDASGKVIAWSHEGDWEKQSTKNGGARGRGKAANLSDVARRKSEKLAKEEVEDIEEAAYTDVAAVRAKYKENESDNRHTENAELLAKHFGSKSDQNKVAKAKAYRDRNRGYRGDAEGRMHSNLANEVHSKLYHHIKEEVEELDELSKGTLKSYVGKAVQSHGSNRVIANMAWDKSEEPGDLLDKLGHKSLKDSKKRSIGIAKAVDKLTKEEVEEFMQTEAYDQLDEVDKKTLGNYIAKAHDQLRLHSYQLGSRYAKDFGAAADHEDEYKRKENNRTQGIKTAVKKLTKEDNMLTYSEFMAQLAEGKADDLRDKLAADRERRLDKYDYSKEKDGKVSPVKNVKGHSYGAGEDSEEGEDEVKTAKPAAVKRGRGRPAGSKSGARV